VNDLKDLFGLALADGGGPGQDEPVDPAADLARGRRLLRRRRLAGLAGVATAVLCGALVPLALHSSSGTAGMNGAAGAGAKPAVATSSGPVSSGPVSSGPVSSGPASASSPGRAKAPHKIALVVWTGTQPPGYRVNEMPKGWVVQGSTPYALVIAPPDDPSKNPDAFIGKLVVMLQSKSVTSPPTLGTAQPVNGRAGMFDVQGDTQILTFQVEGGAWVVIQAPVSLGWSGSELAQFAGGVQVLVTAQQGVG
jgi:hypothetical protein